MPVTFDRRGHVALITIEGYMELNPLTLEMHQELGQCLVRVRDDADVWVAILTSKGEKAFSVGGDLKRSGAILNSLTNEDYIRRFWNPTIEPRLPNETMIERYGKEIFKPIIGAVHGYCLGAALMYVMCYCDIRVATEDAKFGFSEIKRGLAVGACIPRLASQIPYCMAMELALTGEMVDAREAHRMGLINKVVPTGGDLAAAEAYAAKLVEISPQALMAEKEAMIRSLNMPYQEFLRYAQTLRAMQFLTPDMQEGVKAFREHRKPAFKGY